MLTRTLITDSIFIGKFYCLVGLRQLYSKNLSLMATIPTSIEFEDFPPCFHRYIKRNISHLLSVFSEKKVTKPKPDVF